MYNFGHDITRIHSGALDRSELTQLIEKKYPWPQLFKRGLYLQNPLHVLTEFSK